MRDFQEDFALSSLIDRVESSFEIVDIDSEDLSEQRKMGFEVVRGKVSPSFSV